MLQEVISYKKKKTIATKKATMSDFIHQYHNIFNFLRPILPATFDSNFVGASTPISMSNEQNLREEKQKKING